MKVTNLSFYDEFLEWVSSKNLLGGTSTLFKRYCDEIYNTNVEVYADDTLCMDRYTIRIRCTNNGYDDRKQFIHCKETPYAVMLDRILAYVWTKINLDITLFNGRVVC